MSIALYPCPAPAPLPPAALPSSRLSSLRRSSGHWRSGRRLSSKGNRARRELRAVQAGNGGGRGCHQSQDRRGAHSPQTRAASCALPSKFAMESIRDPCFEESRV
eukprot:749771-Pleurochrysis_carterae.AAC.1